MSEIKYYPLIDVRCISCGKVTGHIDGEYLQELAKDNVKVNQYLTRKGFPPSRICCRRTLLTPIQGIMIDEAGVAIEEAIYSTETFEESQSETVESDDYTPSLSKDSVQTRFNEAQKNKTAPSLGKVRVNPRLLGKQRKKQGGFTTGKRMNQQSSGGRKIPGIRKKQ